MQSTRLNPSRRTSLLVSATLACTLLALPNVALGQGFGSNPGLAAPVADGTLGPGESSSAAFAGALASADPNTGAARASFPFRLEAARGKVQPSLGLDYSSLGGQREAGAGWGLSLPSIQRKNAAGPPNYAHDPSSTTPLSASLGTDRFVFGGAQLVPICQISGGICLGAPAGETMPSWAGPGWTYFRAEVDRTFERFFWSADHLTWVVEERSGATIQLGQPLGTIDTSACDMDQSNVIDPSTPLQPRGVFRWNLVRQRDAMGSANEIQYVWSNVNAAQRAYLTDIYDTSVSGSYVAGENAGLPAVSSFAHHTHLTWTPDQPLPYEMRPRMFRAAPDQLLTKVDVTSATFAGTTPRALVRSYALTYVPRGTLGLGWWRTALSSIQMTGACAGVTELATGLVPAWAAGACPTMPAISYQFASSAAPSLLTNNADASLWTLMGDMSVCGTFADVDGDGAVDVIHAPNWPSYNEPSWNYPQYYRNLGGGQFFSAMGQLTLADQSIGGGEMEGEIFNAVDDSAQDGGQPFYTVVGNFGLNFGPGVDILTANTVSQQYMTFSTTEALLAGAPQAFLAASSSGWTTTPILMGRAFGEPNAIDAQVDVDGDGFPDWTGLDSPTGTQVVYTAFSSMGAYGHLVPAGQPIPDQQISLPDIWDGSVGNLAWFFFDANGDGLPDIISGACTASSCSFAATLGKGDGTYNGTATWALPAALASEMTAGDAYAYIHDVNGDGYADLVVSDNGGVEVLLAQGIQSNGSVQLVGDPSTGAPFHIPPPVAATQWGGGDNLRFADVDASGADDIVFFVPINPDQDATTFQPATLYYVDLLAGGPTPLLQVINNGLGATTTLTYDTTAHLSAAALDAGSPWTTQSPQNMHVVTQSETFLAGNIYAGGPYTTTYEYANPVYDKRFREFRGFDFVRTTHRDALTPANDDVTETTFLTMVTPTASSEDVPWDALVGLPVLSTTYSGAPTGVAAGATGGSSSSSAPGPALVTTHSTYSVTALTIGVDGRVVRSVYPSVTDVWHYSPSALTSGNGSVAPTLGNFSAVGIGGVVDAVLMAAPNALMEVPLLGGASSSLTFHTSTLTAMDTSGNLTSTTDNGADALPDVPIVRTSTWVNVGDWNWRPSTTSVGYPSGPQRSYTHHYDSYGNELTLTGTLSGALPLVQSTVVPPVNAASNGTYTALTTSYDAYGNVTLVSGANGFGSTTLTYDLPYAQLVTTKTTVPSGVALVSRWSYDRGFGAVTSATGVDGAVTTTAYDAFGRINAVYLPNPAALGQSDASPDVALGYDDVANGPFQYTLVDQVLDAAGDERWRIILSDALGRKVLTMATGGAADAAGSWICSGLEQRDAKGRVSQAFAPYQVTTVPAIGVVPLTTNMTMKTLVHDPFGDTQEVFDLDGNAQVLYRYNALSRDMYDAVGIQALNFTGAGTFSTVRFDGHGRTIESDEQTVNGGGTNGMSPDVIETTVTYQATGEPLQIARASTNGGGNTYVRNMQYDSRGRLVRNIEPNTATFNKNVAVAAWTYAYDLNGQLVGTSDARGCGVNYTYDNIGRETSEDYVPCEAYSQPAHSVPGAAGVGTEVYNVYDAPEPGETSSNAGTLPGALVGRLAATYSRGEHTNYAYDGRGRVTQIARQMPTPNAEAATGALSGRYESWWYTSNMLYDNANRVVGQTTGAADPDLRGTLVDGYTNLVTATYDARDIPVQVGGSYGPLVSNELHDSDGRLLAREYADNAVTTAFYAYDGRRNLQNALVTRPFDPTWTASTAHYTPPHTSGTPDYTTQTILQDLTYTPDRVNNPTVIQDQRLVAEWPPNEGPIATTTINYDDRYRVTKASYGYPGGASEAQAAAFTPTDPPPISFQTPTARSSWQSYQYDWQGNVVASDDDAHSLLQRSSGTAVYGSGGIAPNRVQSGSNAQGSYVTAYDAAGDLTSLTTTLPTVTGTTTVTLTYDWDEAGHLRTAARSEVVWVNGATVCGQFGCVYEPPHEGTVSGMQNAYLYDGSGQRTWHSSNNGSASGADAYTLEVFPSLHVEGATWSALSGYGRTPENIASYLVIGDSSYGRVVYDGAGTLPSPRGLALHVYLQIADPLGSTSSTIDRDSSELVEQITYLAYGQTETDYRPARWQSFREGYRYTGKEDDYDVGLTYFGARYYVPGLNRWASADPLAIHGFGGDVNPYSFVGASPFRFVDPFGLTGAPSGIDPNSTQSEAPDAQGAQYSATCSGGACGGNAIEFWNEPSPQPFSDSWASRALGVLGQTQPGSLAIREYQWVSGTLQGADLTNARGAGREAGEWFLALTGAEEARGQESSDDPGLARFRAIKAGMPGEVAFGISLVPGLLSEGAGLAGEGASASTYVYQLVDESGDAVYYGISNNPVRRLAEHAADAAFPFSGMQIISEAQPLAQAQALETSLIQGAVSGGRTIYNVALTSISPLLPVQVPSMVTPLQTLLNPKLY